MKCWLWQQTQCYTCSWSMFPLSNHLSSSFPVKIWSRGNNSAARILITFLQCRRIESHNYKLASHLPIPLSPHFMFLSEEMRHLATSKWHRPVFMSLDHDCKCLWNIMASPSPAPQGNQVGAWCTLSMSQENQKPKYWTESIARHTQQPSWQHYYLP